MRIVAGEFKGRQLVTPPGDRTRPTAARAREALFAILGDVSAVRVLDLYAGSGALGLEALSRGAQQLVLVEAGRAAQRAIRTNIEALGVLPHATLLPLRAEASLKALDRLGPFDLVFADPPWSDAQDALTVFDKLVSCALLDPAARLVLEHAARTQPTPSIGSHLQPVQTRHWGDTAVTIFEVRAPAAVGAGPAAVPLP